MKFQYQIVDYHDEEDWDHSVEASDEQDAARDAFERNHSNTDYAEECGVRIKDANGKITKWNVFAEPSVEFRAIEAKE